jgi:hypothetical protein
VIFTTLRYLKSIEIQAPGYERGCAAGVRKCEPDFIRGYVRILKCSVCNPTPLQGRGQGACPGRDLLPILNMDFDAPKVRGIVFAKHQDTPDLSGRIDTLDECYEIVHRSAFTMNVVVAGASLRST